MGASGVSSSLSIYCITGIWWKLDIPVVDGEGLLVGVVSIGDLVKTVLDQQKETISFLKEYIERTY